MPPAPIYRWTHPTHTSEQVEAFARESHLPQVIAQVLLNRGIDTPEAVQQYLHPEIDHLYSPLLMRGMAEAIIRIQQAIAHCEPILIYGDYDVDGTIATVLLKTAIDRITPQNQSSLVRYHIPHRIREGYGMQASVLAQAATDGVKLVISVDTGIRAFAAAEEARAHHLDLIVTDHHLPDEIGGLPEALAVINPNQPLCTYPNKDLCGAGVAFKLAQALLGSAISHISVILKETPPVSGVGLTEGPPHLKADGATNTRPITPEALRTKLLPSFLKLLAIATVADVVPLTGENRAIVSIGLRELQNPIQPGLRHLMQLAQLDPTHPITATGVAFRLAPRINAAGRMDVASDVVELFLTRSTERGIELASHLHQLNDDRRASEADALANIDSQLEAILADEPSDTTVVLDNPDWHRGVIGILASRVVERTNRPALVITHEDGQAHGSGRSIPGFHLLQAITTANSIHLTPDPTETPLFTRFGGHAHAVGFSLPSANLPLLRTRLRDLPIAPSSLIPELFCDAYLPFNRITPTLITTLRQLEPHGQSNPEPVFFSQNARLIDIRSIKDKHLRLRLQQDNVILNCLAWSRQIIWPERLESLQIQQDSLVDLAFRLRENTHPTYGGPELELCDIQLVSVQRDTQIS